MLTALEREMPSDATWTRPDGGYFIWLQLPPSAPPAVELLTSAEAAGVTFVQGADFYAAGGGGEHALRLAFSFVSPDEIADGVARLAALI
jgi:2-aminoadipate transaminase